MADTDTSLVQEKVEKTSATLAASVSQTAAALRDELRAVSELSASLQEGGEEAASALSVRLDCVRAEAGAAVAAISAQHTALRRQALTSTHTHPCLVACHASILTCNIHTPQRPT